MYGSCDSENFSIIFEMVLEKNVLSCMGSGYKKGRNKTMLSQKTTAQNGGKYINGDK